MSIYGVYCILLFLMHHTLFLYVLFIMFEKSICRNNLQPRVKVLFCREFEFAAVRSLDTKLHPHLRLFGNTHLWILTASSCEGCLLLVHPSGFYPEYTAYWIPTYCEEGLLLDTVPWMNSELLILPPLIMRSLKPKFRFAWIVKWLCSRRSQVLYLPLRVLVFFSVLRRKLFCSSLLS